MWMYLALSFPPLAFGLISPVAYAPLQLTPAFKPQYGSINGSHNVGVYKLQQEGRFNL